MAWFAMSIACTASWFDLAKSSKSNAVVVVSAVPVVVPLASGVTFSLFLLVWVIFFAAVIVVAS
ncbi:MAG: hypothetical protein QNI94_15005 [Kiloniellales bacterium]|nr:hypothetical protein [Kiloniellales bacterium]